MTYNVSSGTLSPTHSLTHSHLVLYRKRRCWQIGWFKIRWSVLNSRRRSAFFDRRSPSAQNKPAPPTLLRRWCVFTVWWILARSMEQPWPHLSIPVKRMPPSWFRVTSSDWWLATEENDLSQCQIWFKLIFSISTWHDTMPLYKYLKLSEFKHTIKH